MHTLMHCSLSFKVGSCDWNSNIQDSCWGIRPNIHPNISLIQTSTSVNSGCMFWWDSSQVMPMWSGELLFPRMGPRLWQCHMMKQSSAFVLYFSVTFKWICFVFICNSQVSLFCVNLYSSKRLIHDFTSVKPVGTGTPWLGKCSPHTKVTLQPSIPSALAQMAL